MAAKRPAGEGSPVPPAKKPVPASVPINIPPATSQEDLEIKVLQVQNRKLSERLKEKNHKQQLLSERVESLEKDRDAAARTLVIVEKQLQLLPGQLQAHLGVAGEELGTAPPTNLAAQSSEAASRTMEEFFSSLYSCLASYGEKFLAEISHLKESSETTGEENSAIARLEAVLGERQRGLDALQSAVGITDSGELQRMQSQISFLESKCDRVEKELEDVRHEKDKAVIQCEQLQEQLTEARERPQHSRLPSQEPRSEESLAEATGETSATNVLPGASVKRKLSGDDAESVLYDLDEAQRLSESRLAEVSQLSQQITELRKELETTRHSSLQVSEAVIRETPLFKSLQTQYSVLVTDHQQLRNCFEEARRLLVTARTQHIMQLEEIRQEELKYQGEVRDEMASLETSLAQVKRDYEILKIEHEQTMAANEQAAPIARELQEMVNSLQKNIQQLKAEVGRYKARAHKAEERLNKDEKEKGGAEKLQERPSTEGASKETEATPTKVTKETSDRVKALEAEKKSLESKLEGFVSASKDQRERAEIIAAEKKARAHVEELKKHFDDSRKEYERKKEHLKEDMKQLQKELANKKQEGQALMTEMESTAQAYEEMQEQNIRLLQQLKEKDDANFKLMSERIKSSSMQKLLVEEKQLLQSEVAAVLAERDRLNTLVQKLEDREKNSEATIVSAEKDLNLKQQALELHRKKSQESAQSLQEVQFRQREMESQLLNSQQTVLSKTEELDKELQSSRRAQEEIAGLKRRLEKYKHREWASMGDEVLLEEIKTYKAKLNCPCCSSRKKDTVLTKCFHVFCAECIRTRYETRQRKCPKCNAAFGANDFHKIYLS